MKNTKRLFAVLIAMLMIFSMNIIALAANTDGKITVANATIGETYEIYKIFDAKLGDDGAITYVYDGTLPENDYFTQDEYGFIGVQDAAVDANGSLTEGAITFLGTLKTTAAASVVATGSTVVFDELAYGYYYVTSSLGVAVTIDSTNPEVVIIDKNGAPSISKTVNKEETTIGETLIFTVEVPLVQYEGTKKVTEYYVFDNMEDCMTYNNDLSATIKVGDGEATAFNDYKVYTKGDETFELAEDQEFLAVVVMQNTETVVEGEEEVTVYDGTFIYDANAVVTFTYSATVNENVKSGEAMLNYVELNWATNEAPNQPPVPPTPPTELPAEPNGEGPNSTTKNYSAAIELTKINGENEVLVGAKFVISGISTNVAYINKTIFVKDNEGEYWMLNDGTYTTEEPENNDDKYDSVTQKYSKITTVTKDTTDIENITAEGYVDENGVITFTGLGEGTYTITEIIAPSGYNRLTDAITVVIDFNEDEKVFTATVDENAVDVVDGVVAFDVINYAGAVLPGTGGIGTTIFYVLGGLLLVGAAVLLITKKFASAKR